MISFEGSGIDKFIERKFRESGIKVEERSGIQLNINPKLDYEIKKMNSQLLLALFNIDIKFYEKLFIRKIKQIPIFANLSNENLKNIISIIKERSIHKDETINKEGETGNEMYILFEGEIEITRSLLLKLPDKGIDQKDKQFLILNGSSTPMFGEMALFDKHAKRSATVLAKTKCVLGVISREDFLN